MWQGTGSTNKWNLSWYNLRILVVLFDFRWFVHGGGVRQRQYWHLIPLWTRVGKLWQIVWQGPRFGFAAEMARFVTIDALSPISCFCALLPSFLLSLRHYPGMFIILRIASSVQQSSALRQRVYLRNLCSSLYLFYIFRTYFLLFLLVLSYPVPGTLAFDLPSLVKSRFFSFFFSLLHSSLWPHNLYI